MEEEYAEGVWTEENIRDAIGDEDRYGLNTQKQDNSPVAFLKKVVTDDENIKTANLKEEEVGFAKTPLRTSLELSTYCDIMGMAGFSDIFAAEGQIIASSSLSRDAVLINLAVTQKKQSETALKKVGQVVRKRGLLGSNKNQQQGGGMM